MLLLEVVLVLVTAAGWRLQEPCWRLFDLAAGDGSRERWCSKPKCHTAGGVHVPRSSAAAPRCVPLSWKQIHNASFVRCEWQQASNALAAARGGVGGLDAWRGAGCTHGRMEQGDTGQGGGQGGEAGWRWASGVVRRMVVAGHRTSSS